MKVNRTLTNQSCANVDSTYKMINSVPTVSFSFLHINYHALRLYCAKKLSRSFLAFSLLLFSLLYMPCANIEMAEDYLASICETPVAVSTTYI